MRKEGAAVGTPPAAEIKGDILLYQTEDGFTRLEVQLWDESVWLTQAQMAELFQRDVNVISRHIKNVFAEHEAEEKSNLQNMQIVNSDKCISQRAVASDMYLPAKMVLL